MEDPFDLCQYTNLEESRNMLNLNVQKYEFSIFAGIALFLCTRVVNGSKSFLISQKKL